MKTINKILLLPLSALLLTACTDLDTAPKGSTVTKDQKTSTVKMDPTKAAAGVNSIFSRFNTYQVYTTDHSDFGFPSVMLMLDTKGFDFVSDDTGYNWYSTQLEYTDHLETSTDNRFVWNTMYALIRNCNAVAAMGDSTATDSTLQFNLAQAYAVRAFSYWVLVQTYQFTYKGNETKPGLPIITEKNMATVGTAGCPRSSVQKVYNLIMNDLNNAVNLLKKAKNVQRADKRYISLEVAYGLRARVELTMENWADAASDATLAMNGYTPYSVDDVNKPSFNDASSNSWMWADVITEDDRIVTSQIVNFASHMGSLNYGYAEYGGWRMISKKLYDEIGDDDVRKGWWLNANKVSPNLTDAQKVFVTNYGFPAYTQMKFGPYKNVLGTKVNAAPIPLMRVEEMYLIKAEATAMASSPTDGARILENFVKTYRDPSYTCTATTAADVQEAVYLQRRIELWGEGLSWFDIMRLKKDVDRRGSKYNSAIDIFNIPAGSDVLLLRIPKSEIDNNVQISEDDNNPSSALPTAVKDFTY